MDEQEVDGKEANNYYFTRTWTGKKSSDRETVSRKSIKGKIAHVVHVISAAAAAVGNDFGRTSALEHGARVRTDRMIWKEKIACG